MTADILDGLIRYLLQQEQLTALIQERLYPDALPAKCKLPAVRVFEVDVSNVQVPLTGISGLRKARVQFDIFALQRSKTVELANVLSAVLNGKRIAAPDCCLWVRSENQASQIDSVTEIRRRVQDFVIFCQEDVV